MKYVSIDIETTGLTHDQHVLEVAMVLEDTQYDVPINRLPHLRVLIRPVSGIDAVSILKNFCNPYVRNMHTDNGLWRDLSEFAPHYVAAGYGEANADIVAWLQRPEFELFGPNGKHYVKFAGKNAAAFDIPFLNSKGLLNGVNVSHRVLDAGNFAMPALMMMDSDRFSTAHDWVPSTSDINKALGLPDGGTHRALDDAREVISQIRAASRIYKNISIMEI